MADREIFFDPMTGKPIEKEVNPEIRFDPMTGKPVEEAAKAAGTAEETVAAAEETVVAAAEETAKELVFEPSGSSPAVEAGPAAEAAKEAKEAMPAEEVKTEAPIITPAEIPAPGSEGAIRTETLSVPPAEAPKKGSKKLIIGILVAVLAIIAVVVILFVNGVFLSSHEKVALAFQNTFTPDRFTEDMKFLGDIMETGSESMSFEGEIQAGSYPLRIKVDFGMDVDSGKQSLKGEAGIFGLNVDFHEYMDGSKILVSLPLFFSQNIKYSFVEDKKGFITDSMGQDLVKAVDGYGSAYFDIARKSKGNLEILKNIFKKRYKAMDMKDSESATFMVNGTEKSCKGYTLTITKDDIVGIYSDFYNEILMTDTNKPALDLLKALGQDVSYSYPAPEIFGERIGEMKNIYLTFYLSGKQLAAIAAEEDRDISDRLEFRFEGEKRPLDNIHFQAGKNYSDIITTDNGSTEIIEYSSNSGPSFQIVYDYTKGKLGVNGPGFSKDIDFKLTESGLEIGINNANGPLKLPFSGTFSITKEPNVVELEDKDSFDIGNASKEDIQKMLPFSSLLGGF